MEEPYVYKSPARRPIMYLAAIAFAGFLGLGLYGAAPWFFFVPVLFGFAILLNPIIFNRIDGVLLAPDYLTLSAWHAPQPIPVGDIAMVELISWSDSTDMKVHLKSGESISAFSGDIPPREPFRRALKQVGIPQQIS